MPFVSFTRAIFRSAEFGFFGVIVETFTHTPRLNGPCDLTGLFLSVLNTWVMAGDFVFDDLDFRGFRLSWLIVGIIRVLEQIDYNNIKHQHTEIIMPMGV